MRCYICDHCDLRDENNEPTRTNPVRIDTKSGQPICRVCRDASNPYTGFTINKLGKSSNLDSMIEELYERIPGLKNGPECPGDCFTCKCTFKTGCKYVVDKPQK